MKRRALSEVVSEAILLALVASWAVVLSATLNERLSRASGAAEAPVLELVGCEGGSAVLRVVERGVLESSSARVSRLSSSGWVELGEKALLEKNDLLSVSARGGLAALRGGKLVYLVDAASCSLRVLAAP
ncbi:MAG: hypothetical protein QXU52_03870 [Fervidicoccaceae archaeon]